MPIVVNGTTIPENVANVLNVNGINITSVVCNGVTVWTQSLFSALWSGSSLAIASSLGITTGIDVSGSSYRMRFNTSYGAWSSVSLSGTFGSSIVAGASGINASGNLIRTCIYDSDGDSEWHYSPTWVTFTLLSKTFTGGSAIAASSYHDGLETSGGLLRFVFGAQVTFQTWSYFYGTYISLT